MNPSSFKTRNAILLIAELEALSNLIIFTNFANAKKSKNTWDFPFNYYKKFKIEGSKNAYEFESNLRKDNDVLKEIKNNKETGLISYLLFEDNKIVIDESDIPKTAQGDIIVDELLPSHSMGKSLVSYVLGHAICEGYISNINEKLTGWKLVENTLFEDQVLIDLLNMTAGDQKYVGQRIEPQEDNILKKNQSVNVNTIPLEILLKKYFQNTKKSKAVYNYSALTTNVIMNYTIFKTGEDWEKLLHKVFNEHVRVKDNVWFHKTVKHNKNILPRETGRYSFYANRYDYLRIGKRILDDWNKDTCVGKYLKTIYKQRINKNKKSYDGDRYGQFSVSQYTKKYGGQFHFDVIGLKKRKILAMDGFGGQQVIVDFDTGRIIVVHSLDRHYNWKKIVHKKLKQK